MASSMLLALLAGIPAALQASELRGSVEMVANPVRKVVTLLQSMQKKVEAEGEKEEELYKKFSCYCKTGSADLTASIQAAGVKAPQLGADIKAAEEELVQVKQGLKDAQAERVSAKGAISTATSLREKEAGAFAATKAELEGYVSAIKQAVAALEKGMAGAFLQTSAAVALRKIVLAKGDSLQDDDREALLSFLSDKQSSSYVPSSGEVTGMLKTMGDSFAKNLAEATETEQKSIKDFEAMTAAKSKEVDALTSSIEVKTTKVGELGMSIVQMKDDLSDSEAALLKDQKMLDELESGCATKDKEYEERVKTRQEELVAIADTIKILNDDDALDLFKKTLPAPSSASLVQVKATAVSLRSRATALLEKAMGKGEADRPRLGFIVLALKGQKVGFDKVIKMIDEMVATLKGEQTSDEHKREYCSSQFDSTEDKKKSLTHQISDLEAAIASAEEGIGKAADEIAALEDGIKALDRSVAEATELRKEQHEDYKALIAADGAAKQLLGFAKNRLNKFYNPKLYKPPAKAELSEQGAIERDMAFMQISEHKQIISVEPPPETWDAYAKKTEESAGAVSMIDLLIKDLDQEMTEAEVEEKNSQEDYNKTIADAKEKRTADSKSLRERAATKADLTADLQTAKDDKSGTGKQMMALDKMISNLHAECDWLVQYFAARKEARAGEIDALGKAKAVLSGADFSLLQK